MKKTIIPILFSTMIIVGCGKEKQPEPEPTPTMSPVDIVDGAIEAPFSVGNGKVVYFSQGYLQYNAAIDTWRFAEEQYEVRGEENTNRSATYNGWIDLFAWGTSGYNCCNPYLLSNDYHDYPNIQGGISETNYDWGVYNAISNGGNETGIWRTLTEPEWRKLLNRFDKYNKPLDYFVTLNRVNGTLLLPDNFDRENPHIGLYDYMSISNRWSDLQKYGAVFLPRCGCVYRSSYDGTVKYDDSGAAFREGVWTSTQNNQNSALNAWFLSFGESGRLSLDGNYGYLYYGHAVRLVKDKQ